MIDPKILIRIGTAVIAAIPILLGILISLMPSDAKTDFWKFILTGGGEISINRGVFLVLMIVPSGFLLWMLNLTWYRKKRNARNL